MRFMYDHPHLPPPHLYVYMYIYPPTLPLVSDEDTAGLVAQCRDRSLLLMLLQVCLDDDDIDGDDDGTSTILEGTRKASPLCVGGRNVRRRENDGEKYTYM